MTSWHALRFDGITNFLTSWHVLTSWQTFWHHDVFFISWQSFDIVLSQTCFGCHEELSNLLTTWQSFDTLWSNNEPFVILMCFWHFYELFDIMTCLWHHDKFLIWQTFRRQDVCCTYWRYDMRHFLTSRRNVRPQTNFLRCGVFFYIVTNFMLSWRISDDITSFLLFW